VTDSPSLAPLRQQAADLCARAHVPFSNTPAAAALLLSNGRILPGVRVESASYSLTMPALLNAYTTAVATGHRGDVVAFVLSRPFRREEALYVDELPHGPYEEHAPDVWVRSAVAEKGDLPEPTDWLSPYYDGPLHDTSEGIDHVRTVADRAYVPTSDFPVGALLALTDGRVVPGVNVEHPDWARILCAERNALGTVRSYDLAAPEHLYLTCLEDEHGTPCGACRQLLAELAPETVLWMDRHSNPPERADCATLLPGSFRGQALLGSQ